MATKFLNRYGESLNEINYDNTQYLSITGTAAAATKLATARTITLGSDCSGSVSFDGSSDVTLNVTVKDDSHNHTIDNIDNLQNTLNGKLPFYKITSGTVDNCNKDGIWFVNCSLGNNATSNYGVMIVYGAEGTGTLNRWWFPDTGDGMWCKHTTGNWVHWDITAVVDFMNKYSSMLNIIGNNA